MIDSLYTRACFLLIVSVDGAFGVLQVAGTAIGLNLLLGVPILPSVLVLAFDGILVMLALPIVVSLTHNPGVIHIERFSCPNL